jgi:hypothetical protein
MYKMYGRIPICTYISKSIKKSASRNNIKELSNSNLADEFAGAVVNKNEDVISLLKNEVIRRRIMDLAMLKAIDRGATPEKLRLFKGWGATEYNEGMMRSAKNDNKELVLLFKRWGADDYDEGMAEGGSTGYDKGMLIATENGNLEIILLFKDWGATCYDWAMGLAAREGYKDLVLLFKEWGATDYERGTICAQDGGHEELAPLFEMWKQQSSL